MALYHAIQLTAPMHRGTMYGIGFAADKEMHPLTCGDKNRRHVFFQETDTAKTMGP
jgi:hypothetical protein